MNAAVDTIARELRRNGLIPFARFMELALYCPQCGFYEQEADSIGRRGDFFTSVSVGSLFGELLASQFARWLRELNPQDTGHGRARFQIVEAGAHDGQLAADILGSLACLHSEVYDAVTYWVIEPSGRRQARQRAMLQPHQAKVRWFGDLASVRDDCGDARVTGVIFSNELLDAMPVRRFGWDARMKAWFEWGVGLRDEQFVWARLPATGEDVGAVVSLPQELVGVLPDGYVAEICPAAVLWWREAAGLLERGKLLTLDYGVTEAELFAAHRRNGTLRAYRRHQVSDNLLARPGEQDLTAHVNFTSLQQAGEQAGLTTEVFQTQAQFLVDVAQQTWAAPEAFGEWNAARLNQFKTLTHPEHLGRAFRILVQSR